MPQTILLIDADGNHSGTTDEMAAAEKSVADGNHVYGIDARTGDVVVGEDPAAATEEAEPMEADE
jgi:hypothetical protein